MKRHRPESVSNMNPSENIITHTPSSSSSSPKRKQRTTRTKITSTALSSPHHTQQRCPSDRNGPRIHQLLSEFSSRTHVQGHLKWLQHLEASCAQHGCSVAHCTGRGSSFSVTHGAKSLIDSITMFLSYYVPNKLCIDSDDQWRQLLVALRTFHMFCVRRRFVKEDEVLMNALYTLRKFNLCHVPVKIDKLCREKWWDVLESRDGHGHDRVADGNSQGKRGGARQRKTEQEGDGGNQDSLVENGNGNGAIERILCDADDAGENKDKLVIKRISGDEDDDNEGIGNKVVIERISGDADDDEIENQIVGKRISGDADDDADDEDLKQVDDDKEADANNKVVTRISGGADDDDEDKGPTIQRISGDADDDDEGNGTIENDAVDEFGYCRYFGGEEQAVIVEQVLNDGWVVKCDDDEDGEEGQVLLKLPENVAKMGMKGMSLSGLQMGLRNGIWRPVQRDEACCMSSAYPPDELFYY